EGQARDGAERDWARALAHLVDPARFPETARLFSSTLFESPPDLPDMADADFALGLDIILDGVATRIARA
ncbi:MAG: TetR/AcrR family transcriptional regulator, partial [Saccharothrix sp.]|nr:TetR/AcrR family transcriptional regulator [Saccharothrix sp.]